MKLNAKVHAKYIVDSAEADDTLTYKSDVEAYLKGCMQMVYEYNDYDTYTEVLDEVNKLIEEKWDIYLW